MQDKASSTNYNRKSTEAADIKTTGRDAEKKIAPIGNDSGLPGDEVGAVENSDDMFAGYPGVVQE